MTVQFEELAVYLITLGVPVLLVLAAALSKWIGGLLGGSSEAGKAAAEGVARIVLEKAINFGIGYAIQKAKESNLEVKFDNAFLATVMQYVVERTPDALETFGITPTSLEAMVKARLGLTDPVAQTLLVT